MFEFDLVWLILTIPATYLVLRLFYEIVLKELFPGIFDSRSYDLSEALPRPVPEASIMKGALAVGTYPAEEFKDLAHSMFIANANMRAIDGLLGNSGSNYMVYDYDWTPEPTGSIYVEEDRFEINQNKLLRYKCRNCGTVLLINKSKFVSFELKCQSCGSTDMEQE